MRVTRRVVVFDAADLASESAFWAALLDGRVVEDDAWHTVLDAVGAWQIGVQLAPRHVPPQWPDGVPQQVHLDLHVEDGPAACAEVESLGGRLLAAGHLDDAAGRQVYADPAGHPFCVGWGHPSAAQLAAYGAGLG